MLCRAPTAARPRHRAAAGPAGGAGAAHQCRGGAAARTERPAPHQPSGEGIRSRAQARGWAGGQDGQGWRCNRGSDAQACKRCVVATHSNRLNSVACPHPQAGLHGAGHYTGLSCHAQHRQRVHTTLDGSKLAREASNAAASSPPRFPCKRMDLQNADNWGSRLWACINWGPGQSGGAPLRTVPGCAAAGRGGFPPKKRKRGRDSGGDAWELRKRGNN